MYYLATLLTSALTISPILALPAESGRLGKRSSTDTYGYFTGQTSSYPNGSGTYVTSGDQYTYRPSGDYCWTDVVSALMSKGSTSSRYTGLRAN